jgi:phage terminase Nu1 subunit (DNA packaging protein)
MNIDLSKLGTKTGVARLVGVTPQAMGQQWEHMPVDGTTGECLLAYCKRQREMSSGRGGEGVYKLEVERARLAHHQANKTCLEEDVMRGALVPSEAIGELLESLFIAFKAKLLSLPSKAAMQVVSLADPNEAEAVLRQYVHEALTELSSYDISQYSSSAVRSEESEPDTATGTNGESVGRQRKETVKRGKRRTRTVEH